MGYAGKWRQRERARELRAQAWTLQAIADELAVSKGSVSVWVRDVDFEPRPRNRGHRSDTPHPLHVRKLAEIERCRAEAEELIGNFSQRDLELFCLGLYAGEGAKTDGTLSMANTNPAYLMALLCWIRGEFDIDQSRLRARLYLHEGLDLERATEFWSSALDIPVAQFQRPYRAVDDPSRRHSKHEQGCATVIYHCSELHRRVMARIAAVASRFDIPG